MFDNLNDWVPKVHPLSRDAEAEDPMELLANPVQGDPEVMLHCILEEFAWMGMDAEQLIGLFRDPNYPVLNQLLEHFGDTEVHAQVQSLLGRVGVVRFREVVNEDPDETEEHEPDLLQLSVRKLGKTEDNGHPTAGFTHCHHSLKG